MTDTGGQAKDETLLDKRAGEAMRAILSSATGIRMIEEACKGIDEADVIVGMAKTSYAYAEAMIAEKRRKEA